jgi:hypothetical protein
MCFYVCNSNCRVEGTVKDERKVTLSEKPTEEAVDAESKEQKDEAANEAGEKEAEGDKVFSLMLLLLLLLYFFNAVSTF